MAITHATWPWASRFSAGTPHYKNLYNNTFGYTETQKKVAAGATTAVMAATNAATSVVTVTTGLTQPDVPRNLTVTAGGTTADIRDSLITITGTNVEGKTITEDFRFADQATGTVTGNKAFKTVTSVRIGQQGSANPTFAVGTGNKIGVNHRLFKSNTTVKVYSATAVKSSLAPGALTLQGAPTVASSEAEVESNTVTPATTPNGSTFLIIAYTYDNWADGTSVNDQPEYSTTTSTSSTSSSTSTTTITTSTSSTSSSTSSTSISTSSTSVSTSSTSTSTTTAP